MEVLVESFNKLLEEKNKEIEQKFLLKYKKSDKNTEHSNDNIDVVDYTTKKTLSKINAEQDRKYKASKAYKNLMNII